MSEEKKTANMLTAADMTSTFFDILPAQLEDMMSKGDASGCLELVKFVRRFVPDVPVTDYRTVGFPTSIKAFLDACGLENAKDYNIEASSLDANSHVVSFRKTDATGLLLGCIAGLRVSSGPSVCDRLYCEMCKEKDRDFKKAMMVGEIGDRQDFRTYVIARTEAVYCALVKELEKRKKESSEGKYVALMSPSDEARDLEILEFAATQITDWKLKPTSTAVVPPPVAELYWALHKDDERISGTNSKRVFMLGKNPGEWVAARALSINSQCAPTTPTSAVPAQVLRKFCGRFDRYMPVDAYTFSSADTVAADSAYVLASSLIRLPAETAEETIVAFNGIEYRRPLFEHVRNIYKACYPDLAYSFYSDSGVRFPVKSKYARMLEDNGTNAYKIAQKADDLLGLTVTDDNPCLVMTCAFLMSPFTPQLDLRTFETGTPTKVIARKTEKEDKKKKRSAKEISVAEAWFKLIHNVDSPGFTDEEAATKMEPFLTESIQATEIGSLPTAIAIGIRSAIAKMQDKSSSSRIKGLNLNAYRKNAQDTGLHTNDKFITQLISTVTGPGAKTLSAFVKETEAGKCPSAPATPPLDYLFPTSSRQNVTKFLDIADKTAVQIKTPRKISDFVIYAETNIGYDALTEIYESTAGFTNTLQTNIGKELSDILFLNKLNKFKKDEAKPMAKITRALGKNSAIITALDTLTNVKEGTVEKMWFSYFIEQDDDGRAILGIRVDRAAAFLAMLLDARDADLDGLIAAAIKYDPASVFLSDENWRAELMDHLLSERDMRAGHLRSASIVSKIYDFCTDGLDEDDFIVPDVTIRNHFTRTPVSETFAHLAGRRECSDVDPN